MDDIAERRQQPSRGPQVSRRALATDPPVIATTRRMMASAPPELQVMSLAQGVVHWPPPPAATARAAELLAAAAGGGEEAQSSSGGMRAVYGAGGLHSYGPSAGLPALVEALRRKLSAKNGLEGYEVMVTAGANQAICNVVLALVDADDPVVLFKPWYFNALMAVQMTGGAASLVPGECDEGSLWPDLGWLRARLAGPRPPRLVFLVNPSNPTGVLLPREQLEEAAAMCAAAGCWLVVDNTYEDFVYGPGAEHHCPSGPNVVHIFSLSKAYGMMGWRCGYIAFPGEGVPGGSRELGEQLAKIQDTVAICPNQLTQHVALAALGEGGGAYVAARVASLAANRRLVAEALEPLGPRGEGWVGGEGSIYYFARLPGRFASREADEAVTAWLVREHGVCVIPGSACGAPGHLRVAYANLGERDCAEAAARLRRGLQQLLGMERVPGMA